MKKPRFLYDISIDKRRTITRCFCRQFLLSIYQTGAERRAEIKITSLPGCGTICNGLGISAPTSFAVGSKFIAAGISVKFEPSHSKSYRIICAPSEDSDQPVHPHSLLRIFAWRSGLGSNGPDVFFMRTAKLLVRLRRLICVCPLL